MKKIKSLLMYSALAATTVLVSCSKEEGCTDSKALNFNSDAEEDDGSCKYGCTNADIDPNDVTENGTQVVRISCNVEENTTWTSDNIYYLNGRISVTNGATLTIEPGTVIKAAGGSGAFASALVVSRNGKINAAGTASNPIIFTAADDDIEPGENESPNMAPTTNGRWGGVIILGNAPISASSIPAQIEGIPTSDQNGLYGGDDATHNSGTFQYVSIRHGGTNIGAGNEINGLTLGGVGSGTTIDHIEIVGNQDDGIEWFGGSVDVTDVVIWNAGDDGLDTDQDWTGSCSNFVIVTPDGSAFELDGPEGEPTTGPHQFSNGTVYAGDKISSLIDWDGSTNAGVENVYFYGLESDYTYLADNGDGEEFFPFASFGGDGTGTTANLEVMLNGQSLSDLFAPGATIPSAVTAVTTPTVGHSDGTAFAWTWASTSGALSAIGIQ